ncbi:MAG: hypothetical protein ACJ789_02240 [Thermomicrobiales bacterium]
MTNLRFGVAVLLAVAVLAGITIGYAVWGLEDAALLSAATTTPLTPVEPTATLPTCSDPQVGVGEVCLPLYLKPPICAFNELPEADPAPCRKRVEPT